MDESNKEVVYGKDAKEWLGRWDKGDQVWSIEMGGLGPGYEQALQITVAEILRIFVNSSLPEQFGRSKELIEALDGPLLENPVIKDLGITGAMYSAAAGLACALFFDGPVSVMSDESIKDRHILVSRTFPTG